MGEGRQDSRGRLAHHALVIAPRAIVRVVNRLVVGGSGALPRLKVLKGACSRRGRDLRLHRLEHHVWVRVELQLIRLLLELLLLLLLLLEHEHISVMLLLLLYCGRLLRILDGPAPVAELEADLLWHLDRHRAATSRIGLCQIGSLRADLIWREAREVGLDRGVRLVHLQRRHRDVVLVLLTDLEGLL